MELESRAGLRFLYRQTLQLLYGSTWKESSNNRQSDPSSETYMCNFFQAILGSWYPTYHLAMNFFFAELHSYTSGEMHI